MNQPFSHIIGNDQVKAHLCQMMKNRKVGNAFLFAGRDGIGKSLFARELAKRLICVNEEEELKFDHGNHPDMHEFTPEGKIGMHSIDTLRRFSREVYLPPYEAPWQAFVIHDAERMLPTSANALLKSFEEPPKNTLIILLSSSPASLLPTVLSRCRKVFFQPLGNEEILKVLKGKGIEPSQAEMLARRAQGSVGKALHYAEAGEDPLTAALVDFLARNTGDYEELRDLAKTLGDGLDQHKQEVEKEAKEALCGEGWKELPATQRDLIEKEIQGVVTMQFQHAVEGLLHVVLGWYRDLHLLQVQGDEKYLLFPEAKLAANTPKKLDSIEKVHSMIEETHLAIRRFTPVASAFETLFLRLCR